MENLDVNSSSNFRTKRGYQVISNEIRKLLLEKLNSGQYLTDVAKPLAFNYNNII